MTDRNPAVPPQDKGGFQPYAGVLNECRNLITKRTSEALGRIITAIDEELQARRQATKSLEESLVLLEAQYQLRSIAANISEQFQVEFDTLFRERTKSKAEERNIYAEGGNFLPELSLVEETQISEELTVQNLANRLQGICEGELQSLQPRMAMMLGQDEIEVAENPIGPTAICEALKDICWKLEGAPESRSMILELMVGRLAGELSSIYREANDLLVARRITPKTKPKIKSRLQRERQAAAATGEDKAAAAADTGEILQRLFSPRDGGQQGGALGAGPSPAFAPGGEGAEIMQMLTRLQMGERSASLGDHAFAINPEDAASQNVLNSLLDAGISRHMGSVEGIVIDVVATLFDYIFEDERVPTAMKGMIGRLQIPVLKLALMDHSFFSNRAHPARRLINLMAQAAATWDGELTPDTSLFKTADAIVERIQNEFTENPDVFQSCLDTLETYLTEQEKQVDAKAAALTTKLEERERIELARKTARDALATHLENPELPPAIFEFLDTVWHKTLTRANLEDNADGELWRAAIGTMDDLVWSVLPKQGQEARQQLVKKLPLLIKGLKSGMAAANMEAAAQESFLAELVKLHAVAVKAGMALGEEAPQPARSARQLAYRETQEAEQPPENMDVDLLSRGDWLELQDEGGEMRRVRLTWISPAKTMYLFANRQGQRALALTRAELSRRFANGEATLSNNDPLLDRIVDDVVDGYQS